MRLKGDLGARLGPRRSMCQGRPESIGLLIYVHSSYNTWAQDGHDHRTRRFIPKGSAVPCGNKSLRSIA